MAETIYVVFEGNELTTTVTKVQQEVKRLRTALPRAMQQAGEVMTLQEKIAQQLDVLAEIFQTQQNQSQHQLLIQMKGLEYLPQWSRTVDVATRVAALRQLAKEA